MKSFVFAILTVLATAAMAQELIKVRVAYDGFSMTSAPLYYATQQGLFKKFGLDVNPIHIEGGSTLTQALIGGSIDIAQNGYTPVAAAAIQGADVVFIGGMSNKLPYQLVVKNTIKSAQQLKGGKIAISRYGSSTDSAADFALRHLGLKRNEVSVLQLGGAATRMAAAISGQIDGTMEQQPDTAELSRHNYHVLVDVTEIAGDYPNTSYATTRAFLKKNPDSIKRYFMAMATAIQEFKRNPDLAVKLTAKFLDVKDEANARAAYQSYVNVYPPNLQVSLKGIDLVLKEIAVNEPKAAKFKPEQLVDTSVLDGLEREGFFKKLAASR